METPKIVIPQPEKLTPAFLQHLDNFVQQAQAFDDDALYKEKRLFYAGIRRILTNYAVPDPVIEYRTKIVEVESVAMQQREKALQREIDRLRGKPHPLRGRATDPELLRRQWEARQRQKWADHY